MRQTHRHQDLPDVISLSTVIRMFRRILPTVMHVSESKWNILTSRHQTRQKVSHTVFRLRHASGSRHKTTLWRFLYEKDSYRYYVRGCGSCSGRLRYDSC